MPTPKLSVIIPTYNRARFLKLAIDSVLDQQNPGFEYEIIVVDDGSTDNTKAVVAKYPKVQYIKLTHSGRPAIARNAGLAVARGKYIAFQDSDDIWQTTKLKNQLDCFTNPQVVLAYGNAEYINQRGQKSGKKLITGGLAGVDDYFAELISASKRPLPTSTVVVRADVLQKIGCFNERLIIGTDTECWIRLSTQGDFCYQDQVLTYVRRHSTNISSLPSEGDWLHSIYKHQLNKAAMYETILSDYPHLLNKERYKSLMSRLVEAYAEVSSTAQKLSLAQEDQYRQKFKQPTHLRAGLFWRQKRSLYLTQLLRLVSFVHPPTHLKLTRRIDKLRQQYQ